MFIEPAIIFDLLADTAVLTAAGGGDTSCRAMPQGGGETFTFAKVVVRADRQTFHLLRSVVGTPVDGTLTVAGTPHTIDAGEPVADDPRSLFWAVHASWGLPVTWKRVTGSGSTLHPPYGGPDWLATGTSGASVVTITDAGEFPFAYGRLIADDFIIIDGIEYTVTAATSAVDNVFTDVPITPALAATFSDEAATIEFVGNGTVRGALADYEASEIMGGVQAGDRRLVVRSSGFSGTPTTSDRVTIGSTEWRVQTVSAVYAGDTVAAWDLQLRI